MLVMQSLLRTIFVATIEFKQISIKNSIGIGILIFFRNTHFITSLLLDLLVLDQNLLTGILFIKQEIFFKLL